MFYIWVVLLEVYNSFYEIPRDDKCQESKVEMTGFLNSYVKYINSSQLKLLRIICHA